MSTTVKKLSKDGIKSLKDKTTAKVAEQSPKKNKADAATTKAVVKRITDKKDLMYKYPAEVNDLASRKIFRAKTRRALEKLNKELKLANKGKGESKPEEVEEKINSFKKKHYHSKKEA